MKGRFTANKPTEENTASWKTRHFSPDCLRGLAAGHFLMEWKCRTEAASCWDCGSWWGQWDSLERCQTPLLASLCCRWMCVWPDSAAARCRRPCCHHTHAVSLHISWILRWMSFRCVKPFSFGLQFFLLLHFLKLDIIFYHIEGSKHCLPDYFIHM